MKKSFLISVFYIIFHNISYSQTVGKNVEEVTVEAQMLIQEIYWNQGDIDGFMKEYWQNDSLKFIGSKGITYGWQKTLENYKKSYPNKKAMGELKFTILENKQLSDDYIYVIGKWELKKEKPSGGHFTLLWKKINNQWVIVADHTS